MPPPAGVPADGPTLGRCETGTGGGAVYTGRGPVCGIITRRGAGATCSGAVGSGLAADACTCAGGSTGAAGADADAIDTAAVGGGAATTGAFATTGPEGAAAEIAGRASVVEPPTGGFATTGPVGGFAAIAGVCGGAATMGAAWRGWGTILRGAGLGASGAADTGAGGVAGVAGAAGRATGGAVATTGFAGAAAGGMGRGATAADSCSFFCRIAFSTSPGFDTFDRSIFGLAALSPRAPPDAPDLPRCR
jgi:hypothetical protein